VAGLISTRTLGAKPTPHAGQYSHKEQDESRGQSAKPEVSSSISLMAVSDASLSPPILLPPASDQKHPVIQWAYSMRHRQPMCMSRPSTLCDAGGVATLAGHGSAGDDQQVKDQKGMDQVDIN